MRVLVCGGRKFTDRELLFSTLDKLRAERWIDLIIQGGYGGADYLAFRWAETREVPQDEYAADWVKYGKAAGPIRNKRMIDEGRPDIVIAFAGHKGTKSMIGLAEKAGIPVQRISSGF